MSLSLTVLVPLAGATASFVLPRRGAVVVGLASAVLTAVVAGTAAVFVGLDGVQSDRLGGWDPPLGIELRADGLSAVMLATTAVIGLAISVHAVGSFAAGRGGWSIGRAFWPLWLILWGALNAVFLSGDAFNVYVTLELVTLPAVALVTLSPRSEALSAAMRYLLAALLGSLAYLLGVALLYGELGTLDLEQIAQRIEPGLVPTVAIAAMTAGLMVKAALFPLHFWLPRAHAAGPGTVSAALSALVITASAYLVLRLWLYALGPAIEPRAFELMGVLGALALVWGSVQALRAPRLKLLVAYSTVAQVGYLFIVLALVRGGAAGEQVGAMAGDVGAWHGGVLQAVAHALAKAAIFLAAGNVVRSVGHDRLSALTGLGGHIPVTVAAMGIAAVSLAGLPPSGGFAAKWMMLLAAVDQGAWWWAAVLAAGSLLAAAYLLRALRPTFQLDPPPEPPGPVPRTMQLSALALALAALLVGFRTEELVELLEVGR